jgi:NitT/TauT family transport system permease protein
MQPALLNAGSAPRSKPKGAATLKRWLSSPLAAIIAIGLVWQALTVALNIPTRYLPPLSHVFADAWSVRDALAAAFGRTLLETVLGFAAGSILGVAFGVMFAYVRTLERSLFPLFVVAQTMPVVAFGALVVMWFGNTLLAKVVMALFLSFFPVTVNTLRGLRAVDPSRIGLMRSFGASNATLFAKLALPSAAPQIVVGLRVAISLALIGSIVGEWFGETVGLGVMLLQATYTEDMVRIWTTIVSCGVMGSGLYWILAIVETRFVWWKAAN